VSFIILGIDPGSIATGYGIIEQKGNSISYIKCGVIRNKSDDVIEKRLYNIYNTLFEIIRQYCPVYCAIEEVFHSKNPRSALLLGQVRGVCLLSAVNSGLKVFEYAPTKVKQAVTGYGRAEKEQVQLMVQKLLCLDKKHPKDASDALSIAICHALNSNFLDIIKTKNIK